MSEKTKELMEKLQDGVKAVFESDNYKKFLRFMASFHAYSASNCLLIWAQMPTASLVASYTDWTQKHKRQIKRGEKALRILAPHTIRETDADGNETTRISFHCASCFDISQTYSHTGEPVPELCRPLCADVDGFADLRDVLVKIAPVPVGFEPITDSAAYGYYSDTEKRIVVRDDLSDLQTIKTAIHEIAHAWLHAKGRAEEKADHRTREVQAESVAYVVASWLGLDTSTYSFEYIAGWSSDKSTQELRGSLDVIRSTSEKIISDIEEMMLNDGTSENKIAC